MEAEMVVVVEGVPVVVTVPMVGTVVETAMEVEEGLDQFERNLLRVHHSRPHTNTPF
jgi:uncharacterized membrane protein YqgA involved in biofilm formation